MGFLILKAPCEVDTFLLFLPECRHLHRKWVYLQNNLLNEWMLLQASHHLQTERPQERSHEILLFSWSLCETLAKGEAADILAPTAPEQERRCLPSVFTSWGRPRKLTPTMLSYVPLQTRTAEIHTAALLQSSASCVGGGLADLRIRESWAHFQPAHPGPERSPLTWVKPLPHRQWQTPLLLLELWYHGSPARQKGQFLFCRVRAANQEEIDPEGGERERRQRCVLQGQEQLSSSCKSTCINSFALPWQGISTATWGVVRRCHMDIHHINPSYGSEGSCAMDLYLLIMD